MTKKDEKMTIENKIVVSFDICSSSNIIEDLTLTNNLKAMRNLFIKMKEFLLEKSDLLNFDVYNSLGMDGYFYFRKIFKEKI